MLGGGVLLDGPWHIVSLSLITLRHTHTPTNINVSLRCFQIYLFSLSCIVFFSP